MKVILWVAGILLLAACSSPSEDKPSGEKKIEIKEKDPVQARDLLEEYADYLGSLDSISEKSVSLATEKYVELFGESDPKLCDSAFVEFHKLYEKLERVLNTDAYVGYSWDDDLPCISYDEEGNELPKDKRLAALEKRLKKYGFRVECWEGYPGIAGERAYIATHFYAYVSPEMKAFLEGLRKERDDLLSVDAGISVTEEEYTDRLIWWENFNREHPDFILSKRSQSIQRYLFTYFILGMDNTPSIDYLSDDNGVERMVLDEYFVQAYDYLNKKYPNSESNKLVKPYKMTVLKNDQTKRERLIKTYRKRGLMIDFSKDWEEI